VAASLQALFRRGSQPILGIDVSASNVKLVELVPGGKTGMRLERYAIEPIERGAIVDGNVEKPEAVVDALLRAIRRTGTKTRLAAMALPSSAVIAKRITLPAGLQEDDYELQVENEASQYIPFSIDEVNLDFQILGASAQSEEGVEVLLAASRKEKVEDRVAIAEMAGLRPVVIDVEPYAARASIDHVTRFLPSQGEEMILAVFDIGQSATNFTVVLNGQTVFERDQTFGGSQLTQDIVRLYGLTLEEAELKKKSGDLPDNYASELLTPFVEQGASEVARSLQFFFTSTHFTRVDRIFLAGGCAVTAGLAEAVAERTQVPTEIMSPFQGMEVAGGIRERQLRLDAPALMVGCGLAMRRFDA
jgi:type IV pilus assembly protein PilM